MCDHCGDREFSPIAELSAEHEKILHVAWTLAEVRPAGGSDDGPMRNRLPSVLDVHVRAEEAGLYPLLVGCGELGACHSEELEVEHESLRAVIADGACGRRSVYELAVHAEEEELGLFPAAEFALDDDWAQFEATERFLALPSG